MSHRRWAAGLALVALLVLPGCKATEESSASSGYEPFELEEVEGSDAMKVNLNELAAERIQLETEPVASSGDRLVVPDSAIWIDVEGQEWVYTSPETLTFVRAAVTVDRYEDGQAFRVDGPPTGTAVVSVGVAELIGSEFGV